MSRLDADEMNRNALELFIHQPVNHKMIEFLAEAARNVVICGSAPVGNLRKQHEKQHNILPTSSTLHNFQPAQLISKTTPTLEEFIEQLIAFSNVPVPTLMSTLVYLSRLRAKLHSMAHGLPCTAHRIFVASLILAAKYLNDGSPKNKHWASYTLINTDIYSFGFGLFEINRMEKQVLSLLGWDLRITEQDLYLELEHFLRPLRGQTDRLAGEVQHQENIHNSSISMSPRQLCSWQTSSETLRTAGTLCRIDPNLDHDHLADILTRTLIAQSHFVMSLKPTCIRQLQSSVCNLAVEFFRMLRDKICAQDYDALNDVFAHEISPLEFDLLWVAQGIVQCPSVGQRSRTGGYVNPFAGPGYDWDLRPEDGST
ncbi:PHO85 cyclin-1 [Conoideocrella luteorostrata]|uniref:PHO85 cyclin-1 n=1 Tax=Conoideocrella luteorostrata TaxID=1105319 RepID=A0AAJ0CNH8_9HYPO|nr:PHO85 cyclin-1 [Conoideocrella luteorostrata]